MNSVQSIPTVLVIDDDIDAREILIEAITESGYNAVGASGGHEALEYLYRASPLPSLILLDLMMPQMNGWQFRALQQESPLLAGIPVVIMSADHRAVDKASDL